MILIRQNWYTDQLTGVYISSKEDEGFKREPLLNLWQLIKVRIFKREGFFSNGNWKFEDSKHIET